MPFYGYARDEEREGRKIAPTRFGPLGVACFLGLLLIGMGQAASAASLCVNPAEKSCFATIVAAVAAARSGDTIQVAAGTYGEDVVIGKPLSLIGAGAATTTINAANKHNGIYIDGIDNANLRRVVVSGFTVEHAKFEGILITNASFVTVWNNNVVANDKSLEIAKGKCPGMPVFETSEGDDCGEGIHLSGVDHSIVADNTVTLNSGGILLSDDTGATHDNQIIGNVVAQNPYDCGITLASHPPAALTHAKAPLGVFHNTVAENTSTTNGRKLPGAGAGVGLFTSVPGAKTFGNVVIDNNLTDNGLPGVAMHSHTPGQVLTDNEIIGNTISGNAADTADAATPGPTGINVFGVSPAAGTVITGNTITGEKNDIVANTAAIVFTQLNNLLGTGNGVANIGKGSVAATENWWGCPAGPNMTGCSKTSGPGITVAPWLVTAPPQ